jgi:hypothetical protein
VGIDGPAEAFDLELLTNAQFNLGGHRSWLMAGRKV